jgi:hypothetical protein
MKTTKIEYACNHCGKKPSYKQDTGFTTKILEGSIHGYLAWQETENDTGTETFFCVPHGIGNEWRGLHQKSFTTIKELGEYIGQNKLKTY